jgi:hypothetical protein
MTSGFFTNRTVMLMQTRTTITAISAQPIVQSQRPAGRNSISASSGKDTMIRTAASTIRATLLG